MDADTESSNREGKQLHCVWRLIHIVYRWGSAHQIKLPGCKWTVLTAQVRRLDKIYLPSSRQQHCITHTRGIATGQSASPVRHHYRSHGLGQTRWAEMRATVSSWPHMGLFPHILQLSSWQRSVSSSVCTCLPWHTATYASVVDMCVCVWGHNRAASYYLYHATPDPLDSLDHDSLKIYKSRQCNIM